MALALERLEKKDDEQRQALYDAYLEDMHSAFRSFQSGQRLKGLEAAQNLLKLLPFDQQTPEQQRSLRDAVIACLSRADVSESSRITLPKVPTEAAIFIRISD